MSLTHEALLAFLEEKMALDPAEIDIDTELFSSSILDSFSMIELVMFIETSANITFNPSDLRLDNLDSIERILSFVSTIQEA